MNTTQNTPSQIVRVARNKKTNTLATPEFAARIWAEDKYEIIEIRACINVFNGKIEFTDVTVTESDASMYSRSIAYDKGQGYCYRSAIRITRKHQVYKALGLTI